MGRSRLAGIGSAKLLWTLLVSLCVQGVCAGIDTDPVVTRGHKLVGQPRKVYSDGNHVLYQADHNTELHRSPDGGLTWEAAGRATHLKQHPRALNYVYAVSETGVALSQDLGATWESFPVNGGDLSHVSTEAIEIHHEDPSCVVFNLVRPVLLCAGQGAQPIEDARACLLGPLSPSSRLLCALEAGNDEMTLGVTSDVATREWHDAREAGAPVTGVHKLLKAGKFYVAYTKNEGDRRRLLVSTDMLDWAPTSLGDVDHPRIIFLDECQDSLRVVFKSSGDELRGELWVSDQSGTRFTKSLENIVLGKRAEISLPSLSALDIMANVVENGEIKTKLSHDGGATWETPGLDGKDLQLSALREDAGFSGMAPGTALALGNSGAGLEITKKLDLYLSGDTGKNWHKVSSGPAFFSVGDSGNILFFVESGKTHQVSFSLDNGSTWRSARLPHKVHAQDAWCAPRGTSCMVFTKDHHPILVDFNRVLERACTADDMEKVQSECVMGRSQVYYRTRPDSYCKIGLLSFYDKHQHTDSYYQSPVGPFLESGCTETNSAEGSSKGQPEGILNPVSSIPITSHTFTGGLESYLYLKTNDEGDETVLAWTLSGELWISQDQGTNWELSDIKDVLDVFEDPYFSDRVAVYTESRDLYLSKDRARSFTRQKTPGTPYALGKMLDFHPTEPDWLILHTVDDCNGPLDECQVSAFVSQNFGRSWKLMLPDVSKCAWVGELVRPTSNRLVFCEHRSSAGLLELVSSGDFFRSQRLTLLDNSFGFAIDRPFVIAGSSGKSSQLEAYVTEDGNRFVPAHFPETVSPSEAEGYTIIQTDSRSVFLHVTTSNQRGHEFGALLKSNGNGTYYVLSLDNVNRNANGFVDFEETKSLEGVATANVVANPSDTRHGARKLIKSMITHSDGAYWDYIPPPAGTCGTNSLEECSLHLHGYTERLDRRNAPSSPSAIGILIANGNVGNYLSDIREAKTYLSRDAGLTWEEVGDSASVWEFGDSGSVIITVAQNGFTNTLQYTFDEGRTWDKLQFSEDMVEIYNVATIPTDTSSKFLLFIRPPPSEGDVTKAVQISFGDMSERACTRKDFELWQPPHPQLGDACLFGHKVQYLRKIPDHKCFVGGFGREFGKPRKIIDNCQCTREDYECDFNYYRTPNGECKLVDGLSAPDTASQCSGEAVYWRKITGYRKISIDTCEGGENLDDGGELYPCPGKEDEFKELYGDEGGSSVSGVIATIFFVLLVAGFLVLAGVYAVNINRRGGIRLGEYGEEYEGDTAHRALAMAAGAVGFVGQELVNLWNLALGKIDSRLRGGQIGLYSRVDDEERSRILDSDLEDDELDNPELGDFLDGEERAGHGETD